MNTRLVDSWLWLNEGLVPFEPCEQFIIYSPFCFFDTTFFAVVNRSLFISVSCSSFLQPMVEKVFHNIYRCYVCNWMLKIRLLFIGMEFFCLLQTENATSKPSIYIMPESNLKWTGRNKRVRAMHKYWLNKFLLSSSLRCCLALVWHIFAIEIVCLEMCEWLEIQ